MNNSSQTKPAQSPVEPGNPQAPKPVRLPVVVWTWLTWCHVILHAVKPNSKPLACLLICASANLLNADSLTNPPPGLKWLGYEATDFRQARPGELYWAGNHVWKEPDGVIRIIDQDGPHTGLVWIIKPIPTLVRSNKDAADDHGFVDGKWVKSGHILNDITTPGTVYLTNVASHWTVATNDGVVVTAVAYRTNAPAPAGKTFEPVFLAGLQGSSNIVAITVSTNADGNPVLEDICQNVTLVNFVHKGLATRHNWINSSRATDTNSLPAPVMQTDPMYGTQPNASEIALQWEANPDCERYVVEYLSARTTNQWLKAGTFRPTPGLSFVNASIFVDLDTPCWTRVIGITESGDRTPPTEPLRHPALSSPRPMTQHKQMFVRPTRALTATEMHRNRTDPFPVIPQPPVP